MRAISRYLVILLPMVAGLSLSTVACVPGTQTEVAVSTAATSAEVVESEFETLDPSAFGDSTNVNNQWFPLVPGTEYLYEGTTFEDDEVSRHWLEFTVTDLVKEIGGVKTVVAWILDYSDGELVEKEIAFYAQDNDGNVWYLGEHPEEYEDGQFITAPTWIHGVADGKAGLAMPADPRPGSPSFSQGWSPAVDFSDRGQVTEVLEEMCTVIECYAGVLVIQESTVEEPGATQLKYYAPGVGNIAVDWEGEDNQREELELIGVNQLSPEALAEVRELALEVEAHAFTVSPDVYGLTEPMTVSE